MRKLILFLCLIELFYCQFKIQNDLGTINFFGGYFSSNGSCSTTNIITVNINTVSDFLNIIPTRMSYPSNQLVYFQLTTTDSYDSQGNFIPAYLLQNPFVFNGSFSCSYLSGQGYQKTSVLVDYPNITVASAAFTFNSVNDVIISDVTMDRTNTSWWNPGYNCQFAYYYPTIFNGKNF